MATQLKSTFPVFSIVKKCLCACFYVILSFMVLARVSAGRCYDIGMTLTICFRVTSSDPRVALRNAAHMTITDLEQLVTIVQAYSLKMSAVKYRNAQMKTTQQFRENSDEGIELACGSVGPAFLHGYQSATIANPADREGSAELSDEYAGDEVDQSLLEIWLSGFQFCQVLCQPCLVLILLGSSFRLNLVRFQLGLCQVQFCQALVQLSFVRLSLVRFEFCQV